MTTASVLKVDQPYMSIIIYQDIVLVKIAVGSADISRQRDRCASCSLAQISGSEKRSVPGCPTCSQTVAGSPRSGCGAVTLQDWHTRCYMFAGKAHQ